MRGWKKFVLSAFLLTLLGAAIFLVPTIWFKPWSIDHFYARVFLQYALEHPMMLSSMRLLEPMGFEFHNDDLDDVSPAAAAAEMEWRDRQLEMLRRYDRSGMSDAERLSAEVMEWFILDGQQGDLYRFHDYPLNQLSGIQSGLPDFMVDIHQVATYKDAKNYIARIGKFGLFFDQVLEGLARREELGVVPPRFVVDHVLDEMQAFVDSPSNEHSLFAHLESRLEAIENAESSRQQELLDELAVAIDEVVYPSYRKLIDHFEHLREIATTDDGAWKLPDGAAYYDWCLRHYTTTDMTSDEIHELGLGEVDRIQDAMRQILLGAGYESANLAQTMNLLNQDERFLYPDSDEGRQQILDDYQTIIDEIDQNLGLVFDVRPEAGVEVRRVPESREESALAAYYRAGSLDGSRPGVFFANLRDVKEIPRFSMRTLAYHEAVPGHHFQLSIAQELTELPFFRRVIPFTAYTEGWALYAEQLAAEHGFQQDPYDRLGYLTAQLFRAVRLVVDTGIHRKRWTREEAIDYMLENTGMPRGEVVSEIERYIVNPGQACAYMTGQLEILELRERARAELGDRFELRRFHNALLTHGALPLSLLEQVVEEWIAREKGDPEE